MSAEEFAGRPFVAGTITGYRAFRVNEGGRLLAVTRDVPWVSGDNEARCLVAGLALLMQQVGMDDCVEPHPVAAVDCTCGFYAYFDGFNSYVLRPGTITAIVEGHGRVTVGSRGFRAAKARIVALVEPLPPASKSDFTRAVWTRRVREQYPDVPWYPTLEVAMREHPVVHPEGKPISTTAPSDPAPGLTTLRAAYQVNWSALTQASIRAAAAMEQAAKSFVETSRRYGIWHAPQAPRPPEPANPVERVQAQRQAAAEARQRAGLRGTGGIKHRQRTV